MAESSGAGLRGREKDIDIARWKYFFRFIGNYFVFPVVFLPFIMILNMIWDQRLGLKPDGEFYFELFSVNHLILVSVVLALGLGIGKGLSATFYKHPFFHKDTDEGTIQKDIPDNKNLGDYVFGELIGTKPIRPPKNTNNLIADGEEHLRGSRLTIGPEVAIIEKSIEDQIKAAEQLAIYSHRFSGRKLLAPVHLAGVPLPWGYENTGIFIQGSAGSGKTQAIKQMMWDIRTRSGRDKLVIYDRKPEYVDFLLRDDDVILCPADRRHTPWDVFAELPGGEADIENFIASLMPSTISSGGDGNQAFWNSMARQVMKGILLYLTRTQSFWLTKDEYTGKMRPSNRELCKLLYNTISSPKDLWTLLQKLDISKAAGSPLKDVDKQSGGISSSVLATLSFFTASFTRPEVAEPGWFSAKHWLIDDKTDGQALFLLNPAKYAENYKSYFTVILDMLLKEMISIPTDITRRVWFFIDEFGSLFKLDSIIRLLAEGRSKGACTVIGVQDRAQLKGPYKDEVGTLLNNCNSLCIGRVMDPDEAEAISKSVGDMEIASESGNVSLNVSGKDQGDGLNVSSDSHAKRELRKAILPSDITNLPGLNYLSKFSDKNWFLNKIEFYNWNSHSFCPAFLGRSPDDFNSEGLIYSKEEREALGLDAPPPNQTISSMAGTGAVGLTRRTVTVPTRPSQ